MNVSHNGRKEERKERWEKARNGEEDKGGMKEGMEGGRERKEEGEHYRQYFLIDKITRERKLLLSVYKP